jgi:aryl-alcohol dehydrogenase-like predicted oxidoreductase
MGQGEVHRRQFLKASTVAALSAALGEWGSDFARAAELAGEIPLRTLGRTGLQVSMIGLGGYHAGFPEKEEDSLAIIHRALDLGINFFDNADCYQEGRAEERMGKALDGRRQKIILMTKVDQRDAAGARATLERSLRRLRTDYLDIWQFHAVTRREELDMIFGPRGALETAEQAR